jgi:Flp pilus assembly protein TadG
MSSLLTYWRAALESRFARLKDAMEAKDRGASAVELAIITAVILVIAGVILAAISHFVHTESSKISNG